MIAILERSDFQFPAHAGMNRATRVKSARWESVPRTRGDEPEFRIKLHTKNTSSPHTRG